MHRKTKFGFLLGGLFSLLPWVLYRLGLPVHEWANLMYLPTMLLAGLVLGWGSCNGPSSAWVWMLLNFGTYGLMGAAIGALLAGTTSTVPYPRCGHCGYRLTGNRSGVCPECGAVFRKRTRRGGRDTRGGMPP